MFGSLLPGGCYFLTCAFLAAGLLLTTASAASLGWGHIEGERVQVSLGWGHIEGEAAQVRRSLLTR